MHTDIKTVGLFGKYQQESVAAHLERLAQFLKQRGIEVLVDDGTAKALGTVFAPTRPLETIGRDIDLAMVVGGDGTLLHVARNVADHDVPIVGINHGRLGFLADIPVADMEREVGRILDGEFHAERRLSLRAEILRGGRKVHRARAVNDVIISKGELARLIEFETYVDGEFVTSARGDGIIVATPTGSTAYALSAGGPILHPTLPALEIVPICPHTLSNRPIVVAASSVIEVVMGGLGEQYAHVTFDGQLNHELKDGDRISVRAAERPFELVRPAGRSHYEVLRMKLHWGRKY